MKVSNAVNDPNDIKQFMHSPIYFTQLPEEIWLPINLAICPEVTPNTYFVSNYGNMFSNSRNRPIRYELSITNYYRAHLMLDKNKDKARHVSVHRLVLGTFCPIENMEKLMVNHIDGNRINNALYNLEWVTAEGNAQHALRTGLFSNWKLGDECSWSTITHEQADMIGQLIAEQKHTHQQIADIVGCSRSVVRFISSGISWRDIYYKYNLRKIKQTHYTKSHFTDEQLIMVKDYIIKNLNKFKPEEMRYLCMDLVKDLFNMKLDRGLYVELMDIIDSIIEGD